MPVIPNRRRIPEPSGTAHHLRANDGSPRPFRMLFLDTEAYQALEWEDVTYYKYRLGVTCYYQKRPRDCRDTIRWRRHDTQDSIIDEVNHCAQDKSVLYVLASNPNFDLWLTGFYERMHERGWECDFFYDQGIRFILACSRGDQTIRVLAIQNFVQASVEDLGQKVGLPKLDCDPGEDDKETVYTYCKRDVEIVKEAFLEYLGFLDRHDCGGFGLTLSSQAFRTWRHGRIGADMWVHRNEEALRLEREASYGGRSEAFYLGTVPEEKVIELDVNSLYPYVMKRYQYPVNLVGMVDDPTEEDVRIACEEGCAVADVTLWAEEPVYPLRIKERTCFPVGKFRTQLCTMSLLWALHQDVILDVHRLAIYEKARPFEQFVEEFYTLRKELEADGDPLEAYTIKMLLNSLYGKIGQAPPGQERKEKVDGSALYRYLHIPDGDEEARMVTRLMGRRFVESGRREGRNSMPSVAGHIQDYARWYLNELLLRLPDRSVYYCDTDSIWVSPDVLDHLEEWIDADRLGYLSVEREVEEFVIYGVKDYKADGERVIKGIPKDATKSRGREWVMEHWPGLRALLQAWPEPTLPGNMPPCWKPESIATAQREGLYPVQTRHRQVDPGYYKGTVEEDGWVKPYRLPDGMPS